MSQHWFSQIFERGSIPILEKVAAFTESRQRLLAHNIANVDTPGYQVTDVSEARFNETLRKAMADRKDTGRFEMDDTSDFYTDDKGHLHLTPDDSMDNVLFHDRNNRSIESLITDMTKNSMRHEMAIQLLQGEYSGLKQAIRGRL